MIVSKEHSCEKYKCHGLGGTVLHIGDPELTTIKLCKKHLKQFVALCKKEGATYWEEKVEKFDD